MKQQPPSTEPAKTVALEAARRCLEAYGCDTAKWPAIARDRYGALAMSDELAAARDDAAALDGFLRAASAPQMRDDLKHRIMAQYELPPVRENLFDALIEFFARFRLLPAGALAGVGALGLAAGIMTSARQADLLPEYEAYAYAAETMMLADQEEIDLWAGD